MNQQETNCYTYEVKLTVQVFAENEEQASFRLDQEGGFISQREVSLTNTIKVFDPKNDDSQ